MHPLASVGSCRTRVLPEGVAAPSFSTTCIEFRMRLSFLPALEPGERRARHYPALLCLQHTYPTSTVALAQKLHMVKSSVQWTHMKSYKIEKSLKLPPPSRPKTASEISRAAYTMQQLKAGDSFLIADAFDAVKAEKSMRDMNAAERARSSGKCFAARRLKRGLRIWRIK